MIVFRMLFVGCLCIVCCYVLFVVVCWLLVVVCSCVSVFCVVCCTLCVACCVFVGP